MQLPNAMPIKKKVRDRIKKHTARVVVNHFLTVDIKGRTYHFNNKATQQNSDTGN